MHLRTLNQKCKIYQVMIPHTSILKCEKGVYQFLANENDITSQWMKHSIKGV